MMMNCLLVVFFCLSSFLHLSLTTIHLKQEQLLLQAAADGNEQAVRDILTKFSSTIDVNYRDVTLREGCGGNSSLILNGTALHLATASCISKNRTTSREIVRQLLNNGAAIDARERYYNKTPLIYAIGKGDLETIRFLIHRGANVDVKIYGNTSALQYAAHNGLASVVTLLMDSGADDVDSVDNSGWTALMYAASQGHVDAVRVLLNRGANVNATKDGLGLTPLILAVLNGDLNTVRVLLLRGADINAKDVLGYTALQWAIDKSNLPMINLLMSRGATFSQELVKNKNKNQ